MDDAHLRSGLCALSRQITAVPRRHARTQPAGLRRKLRGRHSLRSRYLLLTYFSRRMCCTGKPASFSASKQASTMFGLPHR